jgi:hypothetical protein
VADVPDAIVLKRDRDLEGRRHEIWIRRGLFALLPLLSLVALTNAFGQHPTTSSKTAGAATLEVYGSPRLRSGLLFEARIRIHAHSEIERARLVLGPGWTQGITLNSIEPGPVGEASADGRLSLELGRVPASQVYVLYVEGQVNGTTVGRRSADVTLYDGANRLLEVHRTLTIFP